jgi:hypothetical protein
MQITRARILALWAIFETMCLGNASALAEAIPTLKLDAMSVLYFEGASTGSMIPSTDVPISIWKGAPDEWSLRIARDQFHLPEVVYPSGRRVRWELRSDARGVCRLDGPSLACQLVAPGDAFVQGNSGSIPMTLTFTTETLSASSNGLTTERQGVRLDPTTGYLQLVTVGVNPLHATTAPGSPFFAVLSGRIVGFRFR